MPVILESAPPTPMPGDQYDPQTMAAICRSIQELQAVLTAVTSFLAPFDQSQTPVPDSLGELQYYVLARSAGNAPPPSDDTHAYEVEDASDGGSAGITIVPGTTTDLTNSGTVWIPTVDGTLINVGSPVLPVSDGSTCAYTHATVDSSTGFITAYTAEADSGSGMPTSTDTDWYMLLSTFNVTRDGDGNAHVNVNDDGVEQSQVYKICGSVPLADGTQYEYGPS